MSAPRSGVVWPLNAPSLSGEDYRLLIESVADYAIFMLDADGRVATWNLGAERIKGYTAEEIVGAPEEDGFSFMRRIRALLAAEGGKIPSLALTAFARDEDRAKAIAAGYTMHIGKPVDPAVLTSSVAELAAVARGR